MGARTLIVALAPSRSGSAKHEGAAQTRPPAPREVEPRGVGARSGGLVWCLVHLIAAKAFDEIGEIGERITHLLQKEQRGVDGPA